MQRARILDQALDIAGDQFFRCNQVIDRDRARLKQRFFFSEILWRADTRNPVGRVKQSKGDLTSGHVGFIGIGDRDQHVSILCASFAQHIRVAGVTIDYTQIIFIL
ncbi:Uncharacterised protein [Vibrio cholerae]|uniref:Uncharacterized protein n=1 Tax=Vibrio cholerae TaxID=666 RepID=A0A656A121_VIBCL|nr:Uncharacterised protein [Vibrio cholerae]CSC21136.1 Uncharacterised protein [Vibrio cholerae]CSC90855.1 Uncharacterised protein [Vibrio cholerae]CSC96692.1 Uncharacterised protein [Vibrio cholerae]CSD04075.1 Uncharacterised protein [Vibrio cholerae]